MSLFSAHPQRSIVRPHASEAAKDLEHHHLVALDRELTHQNLNRSRALKAADRSWQMAPHVAGKARIRHRLLERIERIAPEEKHGDTRILTALPVRDEPDERRNELAVGRGSHRLRDSRFESGLPHASQPDQGPRVATAR